MISKVAVGLRTAIRTMLQEEKGTDVVGEASSFADTMQKIADVFWP
jgi:hypothetical protein